jgi:hypothetical protein
MVNSGVAAAVGAIAGATGGLAAGYFFLGSAKVQSIFTDMGIPNNRTQLEALLTSYGYTTTMLSSLANAPIWDLQCLVAAHLVGQAYNLPGV